jgi:hypothetical protein
MPAVKPFWHEKTLQQMTQDEWESLCDGCGKCCLVKLQDEDTDDVYYTNVSCQYLSATECRCTNYAERDLLVEACVTLTADKVDGFFWLPSTCAYRLLAEGRPLPKWHPLISGTQETVERSGHSVKGRVISETTINADDLEDYIIRWIN